MKQIFLCLLLGAVLVGCGNNESNLTITTKTLPAATIGTPYSQALVATGDTAPYTWIVTSGTLPTGLTLSTSGVISGTPSSACSPFVVSVYGAASFTVQEYTITTILPAEHTAMLYAGQKIMVPLGTIIQPQNSTTKLVVVASQQTYSVPSVSNVIAPIGATGPADYTVVASSLRISTQSLATATVGTAYSQTLIATGGKSPYTWSVASGTLPAGLNLTSGVISGTPSSAGSSTFVVNVSDSDTPIANFSKEFTIEVQ